MSILEKIIEMPGLLPVMRTLGGALIAGLSAYGINKTNKASEEKKHNRELVLKYSFEHWKENCQYAKDKSENGFSAKVLPLDSYIISKMAFSQIFDNGSITKENVVKKIKCAHEIGDKVDEYFWKEHEKNK